MMGHGFYMMGGGSFMMLLFLAAVGFIFYLAINKENPNTAVPKVTTESEALKIAKTRLAKGEISIEEFEQIKANLLR